MAFETTILLSQAVCIFFLAAWLTTGVFENLAHSRLNSTFTAQVMAMTRMKEEYPEAFEDVAYRRVLNPNVQKIFFGLILLVEIVASTLLWIGFIALVMALLGDADVSVARSLAVLGVLAFISVWAGFLVGGNWFCYWFCHEAAQNTHYQMTLWGLGTLVLLTAG